MKVLYDHQAFVMQQHGGVSHYFARLMESFHSSGDVDVDLSLAQTDNAHILEVDFLKRKVNAFPSEGERHGLAARIARVASRLQRRGDPNVAASNEKARAGGYDVFHPTYYSDYWVAERPKHPVVLTVFDMIHEIFPEQLGLENATVRNKRRAAHAADKVIAISETTKNDLVSLLGIEAAKVDVVYLAPFADPNNAAADVRLPEKYVLYSGSRWQYKNFPLFARAFSHVSRDLPDVQLVIAGGGRFAQSEQTYLKELGIENRVVKIDGTDEVMNTALRHADVFAYPSLYEGFGIPILDAWLFNVPVICSDNPVFKEITDDCVMYFQPKQIDSMSNAMKVALRDKELTGSCVRKGALKVADFSTRKMAQDTLQVYRSVL